MTKMKIIRQCLIDRQGGPYRGFYDLKGLLVATPSQMAISTEIFLSQTSVHCIDTLTVVFCSIVSCTLWSYCQCIKYLGNISSAHIYT